MKRWVCEERDIGTNTRPLWVEIPMENRSVESSLRMTEEREEREAKIARIILDAGHVVARTGAKVTVTTTTTTVVEPAPPTVGVAAVVVEGAAVTVPNVQAVPSMLQRSRAEVVWDCHWLHALERPRRFQKRRHSSEWPRFWHASKETMTVFVTKCAIIPCTHCRPPIRPNHRRPPHTTRREVVVCTPRSTANRPRAWRRLRR